MAQKSWSSYPSSDGLKLLSLRDAAAQFCVWAESCLGDGLVGEQEER